MHWHGAVCRIVATCPGSRLISGLAVVRAFAASYCVDYGTPATRWHLATLVAMVVASPGIEAVSRAVIGRRIALHRRR